MNVHRLDCIFKPQRIAIAGITNNPKSPGGIVLRNVVSTGFRGVIYPVNPTSEAVLGIPCFPDFRSLPKTPDLGVLCAPAAETPKLVRECGEAGILGIVIISAGFREVGAAGRELESRIIEEARRFDGMRIIGPNCLGIIMPHLNLNLTFANGMPKAGNIAFISQSGALCTSVLDWALEEKIGFSHFVSVGNMLDVDFGDLIDYFGEDEATESIILYIESITDARKFMTAARSFARLKPIVAYKAGRFPESAAAAASHTGALAAADAVYDAAFQRAGIARVFEISDIFDCTELIGRRKLPRGQRLAIVTNAGGPGVMATDALMAANGSLAKLAEQTLAQLDEALPPFWSHGNPVDVLGDARSKRFAKAVQIVLEDPNADAVLAILTPQAMTNPTATAMALAPLASGAAKPVLATWLGGQSMAEGVRLLNEAGIATYRTPEQAVRAFMTLVHYAQNLEILYETPRDIHVQFSDQRQSLRKRFAGMLPESGEMLSEFTSKQFLEAYSIQATTPYAASTPEEAIKIAERLTYPVVLKIDSPDITHKSDVGGVAVNLDSAQAIRTAFERMVVNAAARQAQARIDGVTVQRMIKSEGGLELILGMKKDAAFGAVIMAGLGGINAEVFGDVSLGLPPLNERLARRMLESLKAWPLLQGYRGRPRIDLDRLLETLIRFSYIAVDYPEISEFDINPLLVTPVDCIALDARIRIDRSLIGQPGKPYAHLALHPYPEHLIRSLTLADGTELVLRPIKPEDEPLWLDLLARCSRESIYSRFRYFFQWASHEVASRYCFIDYDREIAIVAETGSGAQRQLVGVGRLIADPDHETVEYAVLVSDTWQNKGLGGILTDYCLKVARGWGLRKIVAQTTADNARMLALFRKHGFQLQPEDADHIVEAAVEIGGDLKAE